MAITVPAPPDEHSSPATTAPRRDLQAEIDALTEPQRRVLLAYLVGYAPLGVMNAIDTVVTPTPESIDAAIDRMFA